MRFLVAYTIFEFYDRLGLVSLTCPKQTLWIVEWRVERAKVWVCFVESVSCKYIGNQVIDNFNSLDDVNDRQMWQKQISTHFIKSISLIIVPSGFLTLLNGLPVRTAEESKSSGKKGDKICFSKQIVFIPRQIWKKPLANSVKNSN